MTHIYIKHQYKLFKLTIKIYTFKITYK